MYAVQIQPQHTIILTYLCNHTKKFTFPEVGQTWFAGNWSEDHPGQWSAYRIHDSDPQFFEDGVRLVWRVGDSQKVRYYGFTHYIT